MEKNLTTGSVFKTVVYFSLPFLLSYFLQTLYGMADLYIIGRFGEVADTTAVSIGSQVMHMLTVMIVGLAMATTNTIGKFVGAKKHDEISSVVGNTITLFGALSIILMLLLVLGVSPIVNIMSTPNEAVQGTKNYLIICFIGIPFITAYNIISSIFRGMGDSKSPMYFIAIACVSNIILDYVFIGMLGMGPSGAALGTTLSQTISVIISLVVIVRRKAVTVHKVNLKPNKSTMSELLKIGLPIAFQDGLIQISFIIISIIANRRGINDAAAVGIVEKIIGILFLIPSTMLQTVSALSAQNIGAKKIRRAHQTLKYGIMIAVTWGICAAVVMQFKAGWFVGLFTDNSEVAVLGIQYMKGYVWDCILAGIHFCFSGYFCACGLSNISFIHNILSISIARIPLVYLASKCFSDTLYPMGLATTTGSALSVVICVSIFIWINKKQKNISATEQSVSS